MSPAARRRARRERIAFKLPAAVLEYPFECFMAAAGLLIGGPLLAGFVRPGSLVELLPRLGVISWGGACVLGGLSLLVGLLVLLPGLMAAGLRLLAGLFTIYAVATLYVAGPRQAGVAAALFFLIALLAGFRSFYLRTLAEVGHRLHKEG